MTVISLIAAAGIPLGSVHPEPVDLETKSLWPVIAIDRWASHARREAAIPGTWNDRDGETATLLVLLLRKHFHGQRVRNHLVPQVANNDTLGSHPPMVLLHRRWCIRFHGCACDFGHTCPIRVYVNPVSRALGAYGLSSARGHRRGPQCGD